MSVNSIQGAAGFDPTLYNSLVDTAKAKNVNTSIVDSALLTAINSGKNFAAAVKQVRVELPTLPPPLITTQTSLGEWVGMPSPAALFASVIVKDAAEQRAQNKETIRAQGEEMASLMNEQADKIEKGAMQKFACAVAGAVVSMAAGAVSLGVAAGGIKTDAKGKLHMTEKGTKQANNDFAASTKAQAKAEAHGHLSVAAKAQLKAEVSAIRNAPIRVDSMATSSVAQSMNTMISSAGSIISSGGDYAQSLQQADVKRLEAKQEQLRTYQELNKQHNEALKDLISKSLDFMNSMQANMNQTRTKILG